MAVLFKLCYEVVSGFTVQQKNGTRKLGIGARGNLEEMTYEEFIRFSGYTDMFYSHFAYRYDDLDAERIVTHICLDFDIPTDESPIQFMLRQLKIAEDDIGINYHLYYSGSKGFHLVIPNEWSFTTKDISNKTLAQTIKAIWPECDESLFNSRSLVRMPNTINGKSGLHKRLIDKSVLEQGMSKVRELAKTAFYDCSLPVAKRNDRDKVLSIGRPLKQVQYDEDWMPSPKCIHSILRNGPITGQRHGTAMRLLSHFVHYDHLPYSSAVAIVRDWWTKYGDEFDEEWTTRIEEGVKSKYKFGCNDTVLCAQCSDRCSYYKDKSYLNERNIGINYRASLYGYLDKIDRGEYYDLGKYYPDITNKFTILNNDLVGIAGQPGAGKSSFAMDMVMRILSTDKTSREYVVWSNLDNAHDLLIRRCVQWHTKLTKEALFANHNRYRIYIDKAIDWMEPRFSIVEDGTLRAIDEHLRNWNRYFPKKPTIWVIDHIGNFRHPTTGYDRMRELGDGMKSLCKRYNVTFCVIGHIKKQDQAKGYVTISSMRDANIGEACDILIGLRPQKGEKGYEKLVDFISIKARDNEEFVTTIFFNTEVYRFRASTNSEIIKSPIELEMDN